MSKTNLIKLKFLRNGEPSGREYTYISKSDVEVGDTVQVRIPDSPDHEAPKGIVTAVDVPESEVESFKDKLKEIVGKVEEKELPDGVKIEPDFIGDKIVGVIGDKIFGVSLLKESEVSNHE